MQPEAAKMYADHWRKGNLLANYGPVNINDLGCYSATVKFGSAYSPAPDTAAMSTVNRLALTSKAGTSGRFSLPWFLLERAETLEYWPFTHERTKRPVNQRRAGFDQKFGTANGIRTTAVGVNPV